MRTTDCMEREEVSCGKCASSLVTHNVDTGVRTCVSCGAKWSRVKTLSCDGCSSAVNLRYQLRLWKDGKGGWHTCDSCGKLANIDDARWKTVVVVL